MGKKLNNIEAQRAIAQANNFKANQGKGAGSHEINYKTFRKLVKPNFT